MRLFSIHNWDQVLFDLEILYTFWCLNSIVASYHAYCIPSSHICRAVLESITSGSHLWKSLLWWFCFGNTCNLALIASLELQSSSSSHLCSFSLGGTSPISGMPCPIHFPVYGFCHCSVIHLIHFPNRAEASQITDRRLKALNDVIRGIASIKINCWERAFSNMVNMLKRWAWTALNIQPDLTFMSFW